MADIERLRQFWRNPNVRGFAKAVRFCEGTLDEDGYRRMFGGEHFEGFSDHPRVINTYKLRKGGTLSSTAAGAYQFLSRTWDGVRRQYPELLDFSPEYQDLAFVALVDGRKALGDLIKGDLPSVVKKCALEWASLPGSPYGQPVKSYLEVQKVYLDNGGSLSQVGETSAKSEAIQPISEPPMLSVLAPVVKLGLLEVLPRLAKLFGSGSEVSDRNIKVIEAVTDVAKSAVGAKNEQELLEVLKSDPAATEAVKKAVEDQWFKLEEIGGGVEAARKQDYLIMSNEGPWWQVFRSPSFIIGLFGLLPLVYLIVLSIIGVVGSAEWSPEVRASIAGLIVGTILGGLVGYYYGQTTSRNRTGSPTV